MKNITFTADSSSNTAGLTSCAPGWLLPLMLDVHHIQTEALHRHFQLLAFADLIETHK